MAFEGLIPTFSYPIKNGSCSKLIREDCEIELKVDAKKFKTFEYGEFVSSSIYPADSSAHFKWQLAVYPAGRHSSSKGYISCYLCLKQKEFPVPVTAFIRFIMKTHKNTIVKELEAEHTVENPEGWGFAKYCKTGEAVGKANSIIMIAQVSAYCEITSCLKNNSLVERNLIQSLSDLVNDSAFSDVVLCTEVDGTEFKAHRAILASRSEVFAAMFANEMTEKLTGRVAIKDISSSTMKDLLTFVYTCKTDFRNEKDSVNLLAAAEKYNLTDLKMLCGDFLSKLIDPNNACETLLTAEMYRLPDLKAAVFKYIRAKKDKFSNKNHFEVLSKRNPTLLTEIIEELTKSTDIN